MKGVVGRTVDWMVRHRSALPGWLDRLIDSAARNPDGIAGRIASLLLGGGAGENTQVPDARIRVYIAPTNYSGQGYRWARALEEADPGLQARNVSVTLPGGFAFPADTSVPVSVVNASDDWARAEWDAARRFTHVLVEAERSMFGRRFGRDLEAEVDALEAAGVSVAFLAHGTDVRDPDRHAALTPWSPYPDDPRTDHLRADARANLALLTRLRRPTFVSTPDLLTDLPWATWCPVVVDAASFETTLSPLRRGAARMVHASSAPVQKGSDLIEPAIASLIDSGEVSFRVISGVASEDMPAVFADADIVLDQFRLGSYGVAACEALAAGRIVIGHVLPEVRAHVSRASGLELPIVEATPDTLAEVIKSVLDDRDAARSIAAAGPPFVAAVHSGSMSAAVLLEEWITRSR